MDQKNKGACALLETLLDPVKGPSDEGKDAALCKAYNWPKNWFDWHAVSLLYGKSTSCAETKRLIGNRRRCEGA